jgi:hydrogenase-4 component B
LIGGLASFAFVRLIGIVLLGSPRSQSAEHAHESSPWMLAPMLLLTALCVAMAVAPRTAAGLLAKPLSTILGPDFNSDLDAAIAPDSPLQWVGTINLCTLTAIAILFLILAAWTSRAARFGMPTWGCGYLRPAARMQYTGRSFVEILGEQLLPRFVRPRTARHAPEGLFPTKGDFTARDPDPITERVYEPFFRHWASRFVRLRVLQQGDVNVYLIYIAVTILLALVWVSLRAWWSAS